MSKQTIFSEAYMKIYTQTDSRKIVEIDGMKVSIYCRISKKTQNIRCERNDYQLLTSFYVSVTPAPTSEYSNLHYFERDFNVFHFANVYIQYNPIVCLLALNFVRNFFIESFG